MNKITVKCHKKTNSLKRHVCRRVSISVSVALVTYALLLFPLHGRHLQWPPLHHVPYFPHFLQLQCNIKGYNCQLIIFSILHTYILKFVCHSNRPFKLNFFHFVNTRNKKSRKNKKCLSLRSLLFRIVPILALISLVLNSVTSIF